MKSALRRRRPFALALALALTTSGFVIRAQTPAPGDVTVDFQVLGRDGTPVTDLKQEEVTIRIGGRQRQIKSLRLVRYGAPAGPAATAAPAAMPPPYATNAGGAGADSGGRLIFLVVDTESLRPSAEKLLKDSIMKLAASLTPADRIGLVTAPRPTLTVAPTTDRAAFGKAIEPLAAAGSQVAAVCRTRDVLDQTINLLSSLTPADQATVVVMSSGISSSGSSSGCEVTTSEFQRMQRAMDMAGAQVYAVQATDNVSERNDGLETLAGVTGAGAVIRMAGGGDDPLARIHRETASHYEATLTPEGSDRGNQMARVEVRVSRDGATVRANSEMSLAPAAAAAPAAADALAMLKTTTSYTALPLRAVAIVHSRGEGERLNILAMIEANEPGVKFTTVSAGLISGGKSIVTQNSANEKQLGSTTIVLPLAVAGPGNYRLRAAATDGKGRAGAVDYTFDAQLVTLGPLKFAGLVMGSPEGGGCTPKMQYTTEAAVCVVVEMYGAPTAPMTAKLEVVGADGSVLVTENMGGSQTPQPDRFNLSVAKMPIDKLAPGDYTLRAVIGMQGAGEATVSRTLRKIKS